MILPFVLKGGQGLHSSCGCIAGESRGEPMNMDTGHQCTEKSWSAAMNHARRQRRHQTEDRNKEVIAELRVQLAQANQTILQLRHELAQVKSLGSPAEVSETGIGGQSTQAYRHDALPLFIQIPYIIRLLG